MYTDAISACKKNTHLIYGSLSLVWPSAIASENCAKERIANHNVLLIERRCYRQIESTNVEAFADQQNTGSIPGQDLHRVATLANKHEQRATARLHLHHAAHQSSQTFKSHAHIHWL